MKSFYVIILTCNLCFMSCEQSPDIKGAFSATTLPMPTEYKILYFKSTWAIGENTESYTLSIPKDDCKKIITHIENNASFQRIDSNEFRPTSLRCTFPDSIKELVYFYKDKYYYEIFKPHPGIIVIMVLSSDTLFLEYEDL